MSATARTGLLNRAIRRFNHNVYNPLAMTVAGLRHSPYSVVKHIGRKSGRPDGSFDARVGGGPRGAHFGRRGGEHRAGL
jgi:hypothetical protein